MANYASVANMGDPSLPEWQRENLITIQAPNGQSWQVNKKAAQAFEGLFGDLVAEGYDPKSSGGFNYRPIRGSNRLSQHAFGTAIDIDAANNPMVYANSPFMSAGGMKSNLPADTAELAKKWGLEWGGTWKTRPDPMHFEWTGGGAAPTAVASASPMVAQPATGIPAAAPAPQQFGDAVASAAATGPAAPTPVTGPDFSQLALAYLQNVTAQRQQRAQQEAAEQQRRAALFGGDTTGLFG